jgi:hypothetical protein
MDRLKLNYWIDILLTFSFLIVMITGIIKIPVLNLVSRNSILTPIHDLSGIIMSVLVIIHLVLHWKWLVVMTKKMFKVSDKK